MTWEQLFKAVQARLKLMGQEDTELSWVDIDFYEGKEITIQVEELEGEQYLTIY